MKKNITLLALSLLLSTCKSAWSSDREGFGENNMRRHQHFVGNHSNLHQHDPEIVSRMNRMLSHLETNYPQSPCGQLPADQRAEVLRRAYVLALNYSPNLRDTRVIDAAYAEMRNNPENMIRDRMNAMLSHLERNFSETRYGQLSADQRAEVLRRAYVLAHDYTPERRDTRVIDAAYNQFLYQWINDLNPTMSPDLIQAWVQYAQSPEMFGQMISASGYNPNRPIHVNEHENIQLYHYPVPGNGSCGYWSLGVPREEALNSVVAMLNQPDSPQKQRYINMIVNTIPGALPDHMKTQDYLNLQGEKENLEHIMNAYIQELNNLFGLEDDQRMGLNALRNSGFLSEEQAVNVEGLLAQRERNEDLFNNWYRQPDILLNFIRHEMREGAWLGFLRGQESLIDAIADLNNLNLVIYRAVENNKYQVDIIHEYHTGRADALTRHVLFSDGHYDRLLTEPEPINVLNNEGEHPNNAVVTYDPEITAIQKRDLRAYINELKNEYPIIDVRVDGVYVSYNGNIFDRVRAFDVVVAAPEADIERIGNLRYDAENVMDRGRHPYVKASLKVLYQRTPNMSQQEAVEQVNRFVGDIRNMLNNPAMVQRYMVMRGGHQHNELRNALLAIQGPRNGFYTYINENEHIETVDNVLVHAQELLGRVCAEIYNWPDQHQRQILLETLVTQIAQIIENDGHITCAVGKVQRIPAALEGYVPGIQITNVINITPESFFDEASRDFNRRVRDQEIPAINYIYVGFPDDWTRAKGIEEIIQYRQNMITLATNAFRGNNQALADVTRRITGLFDPFIEQYNEACDDAGL